MYHQPIREIKEHRPQRPTLIVRVWYERPKGASVDWFGSALLDPEQIREAQEYRAAPRFEIGWRDNDNPRR